MKIMKLFCSVMIGLVVCAQLYAQTVDDIRKRLGKDSEAESAKEPLDGIKGFKQVNGKYYIVQVKDMSREEAEQILKHMDRLMEEFLKLYGYNFGTQKCFITVYGLEKDFDRLAKAEDLENAGAFSYRKGINHYAVTYYSADLYRTLNHETFHLFIDNIFKEDAPTWFNEGMACYFETCTFIGERFVINRVNKERLAISKEALHTKQWPKAKDLVRFSWKEFHGDNETVNYSASWAIMYFLRNRDEKAFVDFLNDLVLGKSFSTNIRRNYNLDQKDLDNEWVKYIEELN